MTYHAKEKKIHFLFILNEAGSSIYHRACSERFNGLEVHLITPFFSAIMNVSRKLISRDLESLEFGDLRFVFKTDNKLTFIILSETNENLIFISNILKKIADTFHHGLTNLGWKMEEIIENPDLDVLIDSLILGVDEVLQFKANEGYMDTIEFISDQISKTEILGAAILTSNGAVIYSSLSKDVLDRMMRELELRHKLKGYDISEHFYTLVDKQKVSQILIPYNEIIDLVLIVEFENTIGLGMADYYTETILNKIKSALLK